jgi:hypothetical protein
MDEQALWTIQTILRCHPERSEGSFAGQSADPSLRSEPALERSEGMTLLHRLHLTRKTSLLKKPFFMLGGVAPT